MAGRRKVLTPAQQAANRRRRERNKERRRARPYVVSTRLLAIAERDGWVCHLCGLPVPRGPWLAGDEDRPTLDHCLPKSKGGTRGAYNMRLAHFSCNNDRGDRLLWER